MRRAILLSLALAMCLCSQAPISGTSTETTNGISVAVLGTNVKGSALPGVVVSLYRNSYNPLYPLGVTPDSQTVDGSGTFAFAMADTGRYNIIATTPAQDSGTVFTGVALYPDSRFTLADTLRPTGTIHGTFILDTTRTNGGYAYLKGTSYIVPLAGDGTFVIADIPSGSYSVRVYTILIRPGTPPPLPDTLFEPNVSVLPGDTTLWTKP